MIDASLRRAPPRCATRRNATQRAFGQPGTSTAAPGCRKVSLSHRTAARRAAALRIATQRTLTLERNPL